MKSPPDAVPRRRGLPDGRGVREQLLTAARSTRVPGFRPASDACPPARRGVAGSRLRPAAPRRGESAAGSPSAAPTSRPGGMPRCAMTATPSSSGRIESSSSQLTKLGEAALELVHSQAELSRLGLVAGRAVATGQLVQPTEQRTGVAGVATHGGVGPAHLVGVEPQMKLYEACDVVDLVGRVAQLLHALAGHPRPDDVVVMEMDPARADRARQAACRCRGRGQRDGESCPGSSSRRRRSCGRGRPCGAGSGPARERAQEARGGTPPARPVLTRNHSPGVGFGQHDQLVQLVSDPLPGDDLEPRAASPSPPRPARGRARARSPR